MFLTIIWLVRMTLKYHAGVSFGGESSTSCRLINYTKHTLDSEKLRKEIDENREDYLKNLTDNSLQNAGEIKK